MTSHSIYLAPVQNDTKDHYTPKNKTYQSDPLGRPNNRNASFNRAFALICLSSSSTTSDSSSFSTDVCKDDNSLLLSNKESSSNDSVKTKLLVHRRLC